MSKAPSLQLDLGTYNGALAVADLEALAKWFSQEQAVWAWLEKHHRHSQIARSAWVHMRGQWRLIGQALNSYHAASEGGAPPPPTGLLNRIGEAYSQNRLIRSDSPRGTFIGNYAENDPEMAASLTAFFLGLGPGSDGPRYLEAAFRALQFESGVISNVDEERKALTALRNEWSTEYTVLKDDFASLTSDLRALAERAARTESERGEKFGKFLDEADQGKTAIEQSYREHMALKAPVDYWRARAQKHAKKATAWGIAGTVAAALLTAALGILSWHLFSGDDSTAYWRLVVLALFAGIGIWVVRVIAKLFLTNLHQASDGEERVTMVETFLSLISEGQLGREEDRQIVLRSLFRPAQTGLVREEGVPPTLIDASQRLVKGD